MLRLKEEECSNESVSKCKRLTFDLGLDQVKHLAEAVFKGKGLDGHGLQLLALLVIEVLQLVHAQHAVSVQVHAAEPVLYAACGGEGGKERRCERACIGG